MPFPFSPLLTRQEGQEPGEWWEALGGRGDYPEAGPVGKGAGSAAGPLLIHLRDAAGRGLKVEAHTLFSQVGS